MFRSIEGHARLPGKTRLLVDVSGSMDAAMSAKSEMRRLDAACGLAVLAREIGDEVEIFTFSHAVKKVAPRRGFALRDAIVSSQPHGGTELGKALAKVLVVGGIAALAIRSQLRQLLGATSSASTLFTRLSEAGFDVQRDGSIALNETKITSALANPVEARKVFGNVDALVSSNNGIATQIRAMADRLLGGDGTISTRSDGLRRNIDLNEDRQERLENRIAQVEKRLRAQYTALDRQMAQLNSLSGYITQQLTVFNNSGSN